MREPTFHILTALADQPRYGYDVIQEVAKLSDGRVRLQAGTLYAALDRLGDEGLIEVQREEAVRGRLRRYYRLTCQGGHALAAEIDRMRIDAAAAERGLRTRTRPAGPEVAPA
ncbi:MAG: PadR family transcriptional regulator [Stackebrandtia sp.]